MRVAWVWWSFALLLGAPRAYAGEPEAPPVSAPQAVEKANAGVALYQDGKWREALALFRQAESLYHSPVFVLYAARCLRSSGELLLARREYQRLLAENLKPDAPSSWVEAQVDGRAELAVLADEIPSVIVTIAGGSAAADISVDGQRVAANRALELDPGAHTFAAFDRGRRVQRVLTLRPKDGLLRVLLELPVVAPGPRKRPPPPERSVERGPNLTGMVVTGLGGTALLAGGVIGVVALGKAASVRNAYPDSCVGSTCPISQRTRIEDDARPVRTLAAVSDVLLISGAVITVTGVVLLLTGTGAPTRLSVGAPAGFAF